MKLPGSEIKDSGDTNAIAVFNNTSLHQIGHGEFGHISVFVFFLFEYFFRIQLSLFKRPVYIICGNGPDVSDFVF
ncbi:hypothetical protein D3C71_1667930 [compost metagenome]